MRGWVLYWLLRNYHYFLDPWQSVIMQVAIISYKQLTQSVGGENYDLKIEIMFRHI